MDTKQLQAYIDEQVKAMADSKLRPLVALVAQETDRARADAELAVETAKRHAEAIATWSKSIELVKAQITEHQAALQKNLGGAARA